MKKMDWCFKGTKHWREMREHIGWEPPIGYFAYFIGSILFNIMLTVSYFQITFVETEILVWTPATLGGLLFTVGGFCEFYHNKAWKFDFSSTHWLVSLNFVGAILFLVGGLGGLFNVDHDVYYWMTDFSYLVGSSFFMIGGVLGLWLWKSENYGLGLLSEMNVVREHENEIDFIQNS